MLTLAGGAALLCIISNHFVFRLFMRIGFVCHYRVLLVFIIFMRIGYVHHYRVWRKPATHHVSITSVAWEEFFLIISSSSSSSDQDSLEDESSDNRSV